MAMPAMRIDIAIPRQFTRGSRRCPNHSAKRRMDPPRAPKQNNHEHIANSILCIPYVNKSRLEGYDGPAGGKLRADEGWSAGAWERRSVGAWERGSVGVESGEKRKRDAEAMAVSHG